MTGSYVAPWIITALIWRAKSGYLSKAAHLIRLDELGEGWYIRKRARFLDTSDKPDVRAGLLQNFVNRSSLLGSSG